MIIREITAEFNGILEPYLGVKNYGNLRRAEQWPCRIGRTTYAWSLIYEAWVDSSDQITIYYSSRERRFSRVSPSSFSMNWKEIKAYFADLIVNIPQQRRNEIVNNFREFGKGVIGKSLKESAGSKLEDFYAPEEIEFIREQERKLFG